LTLIYWNHPSADGCADYNLSVSHLYKSFASRERVSPLLTLARGAVTHSIAPDFFHITKMFNIT
jgi:hypothetical protein